MGLGAVALAGAAHVFERRRLRRQYADRVGFMPWTTVAMVGTVSAIFLFALALKSGN